MTRRAFTLTEVLVAVGLFSVLITSAVWLFSYGVASTRRLTPQIAAQQNGRKAVVRLIQDVQESMEVMQPRPGSTLPYAVVMDKLGNARLYYQVASRTQPGTNELWRYVDDPSLSAAERSQLMFADVARLAFTSQGEGTLSLDLSLAEGESVYALLTTIRLRNLASAEELW